MASRLRQFGQISITCMALCLLAYTCCPTPVNPQATLPASLDLNSLHTGDLIYRMGRSFYSPYFRDRSSTEKRFSHVGIIVRRAGSLWVIHAEADEYAGNGGVKEDSLSTFLECAKDWAVYRLTLADTIRQAIGHYALYYKAQAIPFDFGFDISDTTRFYCTELVMHCINRALASPYIQPTSHWGGRPFVAIDQTYPCDLAQLVWAKESP